MLTSACLQIPGKHGEKRIVITMNGKVGIHTLTCGLSWAHCHCMQHVPTCALTATCLLAAWMGMGSYTCAYLCAAHHTSAWSA